MERTTVIILGAEILSDLKRVLVAVRAEPAVRPEPVVIAAGRAADTISWCAGNGVSCIAIGSETGFAEACNKGMRFATSGKIVLLAADAPVRPGWLSLLASRIGAAGSGDVAAVSSASATPASAHPNEAEGVPDGTVASGAGISGACLALTRRAMERVGLLDARFRSGSWAFADYALRARLHGCGVQLFRERDIASAALCEPPCSTLLSVSPQTGGPSDAALPDRRFFAEKWSMNAFALI
ncbi:glycosyltransferase family 2 protein [Cohnella sp. 56]|uniref:glycosyltransferase family 2 protein n=1 Tax=Cohnella sp. 56 TaxID=3113722 RepID=UPI0030E850F9